MKTNKRPTTPARYTHGGTIAANINAAQELQRSVMACLLWEDEFYENGSSNAARIKALVPKVKPEKVAAIATIARTDMHLRHVPLLLVREMARYDTHRPYVESTLYNVIQRADEMAEFLSIYWREGKTPLANSVKRGLARSFDKFDEYQFGKYKGRTNNISLQDVIRLVHPSPGDCKCTQQGHCCNTDKSDLYGRIARNELATPDTWEVNLSANDGQPKRQKWTRLLQEQRLGGMALLRNLRNMEQAGVDEQLIRDALLNMNTNRILPFRFIAAAKAAPRYEHEIETAMLRGLQQAPKLPGKTLVVIDVSGSMYGSSLSAKSDMDRALAASALGAIARELCENSVIYATAGNDITRVHRTELVPNRRGMALVDAIYGLSTPLGGGGIFLKSVTDYLKEREKTCDRMIVITDEQDTSRDPASSPKLVQPFGKHNYMINVASYRNGIGYDKWTHIDGWSDAVFKYMLAVEMQI